MKNDRLSVNILNTGTIPNIDPALAKELSSKPEHRSLGIITSDCDDVTYVALDETTRTIDVTVVYGKSMYASAANASTKLAGEVIGIIIGPSPVEVNSGLGVITQVIREGASLHSVDEDDNIVHFAHVISRMGSFLSEQTSIPEGEAIAYLVAPPLGAMAGLSIAMKAADAQMGAFYGPPSEADSDGALLTDSQFACKAACSAFKQVIQNIADNPLSY